MGDTPAVGPGEADRVAYALKLVRERADLDGLRVLDLACCHGAFATAFAEVGADVLGIEARQENLDHAPPSSVRYELGDVRDLSAAKHGTHDVTLCLGILYHLDAEDALALLTAMREVTDRFAVIDTHVGLERSVVTVAGRMFRGFWYQEAPTEPRAAIGNSRSWWFADGSLDDALRATGWTGIERISGRSCLQEPSDRRWLIVS